MRISAWRNAASRAYLQAYRRAASTIAWRHGVSSIINNKT